MTGSRPVTKEQVRARIGEIGIVPAIRVSCAEDALFAAESVSSGGIPIVEVTMTVPGALEVVAELVRNRPEMIVEPAQCSTRRRPGVARTRGRIS